MLTLREHGTQYGIINAESRLTDLGENAVQFQHTQLPNGLTIIGETNLLTGTIVATDATSATLRIGEGELVCAERSSPLRAGGLGTLSVRPEAIRLARAAGPSRPCGGLPATVREVIYLGSSIRVGSAIASGQVVWADLRDEEADGLAPGTPVSLSWTPGAAMIWEGGSDG